ncbi:MAG: NifB/NifX family molybdenum-iron cluster-binding protein [Lentimicrobium sp.]
MIIAIPSNDNISVSAHFGKSHGFIVYNTHDQEIVNEEYRENNVTGHAKGGQAEHKGEHSHSHGEHNHSHSGILDLLSDCEIVIAGGMGQRLYNDFMSANKKVFVTREPDARKAVKLFLENQLDNNKESCCRH